MSKIAAIIGRILIALIFIFSGAGKLADIGATETYMVAHGMPSGFAIPAGLFELLAGLCLAAGFMVRLVAALLAAFVALTILFFHGQIGDPMQRIEALKNLAIIGGLALAFAHSHMWSHYYAIRSERRGELAARTAEERVHDAELRAAKAEARADALAHSGATTATAYEPRTVVTDVNHDGVPEVRRRRRWFDW
ncbi:DoxX family protein [Novosphingobium soli]|uniref:DoxX family protein n=1 Tax=Novosphingobium soli TaxID=574956 RepID=A0ABV6D1A3_9SPHN